MDAAKMEMLRAQREREQKEKKEKEERERERKDKLLRLNKERGDRERATQEQWDRIELLSEQGFVNKADNNALCCRVKVVSAKNKKFRAQIGFVQLTQTTFFTSRALHDS